MKRDGAILQTLIVQMFFHLIDACSFVVAIVVVVIVIIVVVVVVAARSIFQ